MLQMSKRSRLNRCENSSRNLTKRETFFKFDGKSTSAVRGMVCTHFESTVPHKARVIIFKFIGKQSLVQ